MEFTRKVMSIDKVQEVIEERRRNQREQAQSDSRFYSLLPRDGDNSRCLDLKFRTGMRAAFAYTDLNWVNYSPDERVIDIDFNGFLITIQGRGLDPVLYEALIDNKVAWIREADSDWEDNDSAATFIENIVITPPERAG